LCDHIGQARILPRYFYEVVSWEQAKSTFLAPHFAVSEFIHTDVREAPPLRVFPRYIPCATTLLAAALELFRHAVGTYVAIGANGGYCSPRHSRMSGASPHCWGTAANIYRVGDTHLDSQDLIAKFARIAHEVLPSVWTRPLGPALAKTDDHLHLDLGYVVSVPREAAGETFNLRMAGNAM
jgi:hypothetical protein